MQIHLPGLVWKTKILAWQAGKITQFWISWMDFFQPVMLVFRGVVTVDGSENPAQQLIISCFCCPLSSIYEGFCYITGGFSRRISEPSTKCFGWIAKVPEMAKFRTLIPCVFTKANFISHVRFRPTKTCSKTDKRMYSSRSGRGRLPPEV